MCRPFWCSSVSSLPQEFECEVLRLAVHRLATNQPCLLISLLICAGHSLGAGAAALIALKLKDRFPEVKCWAFCPPGGLLTPNMAHSMKPFCTSVVVNKDAIPRMSLKNLNRFMEGKLMALACSRLNAFQIFWGSYGKVNRRHFFDKEIFRPISEMPEEAREMLERYAPANIVVFIPSAMCNIS